MPAAARKRLGLRAGSRLEVIVTGDDRLEVIRVGGSLRDLKGLLPKPPRPLSLAEIDAAVADAVVGLAQTAAARGVRIVLDNCDNQFANVYPNPEWKPTDRAGWR